MKRLAWAESKDWGGGEMDAEILRLDVGFFRANRWFEYAAGITSRHSKGYAGHRYM
jgi:hypothetical protein